MRRHILCFLLVTSVFLSFFGCSKPAGNEISLGQEFTLPIGQSVSVSGENMAIKFVEVVSDSRCPQGATCIWAGEASCQVEITTSGSTYRKMLTQPGLSGPSQTDFQGYEITFDLQPYPQVGKEIENKDCRLQLKINKKQG